MTDLNSSRLHHAPNPWALTPLVVFLLSYLVAVSYTHLDVYKRQALPFRLMSKPFLILITFAMIQLKLFICNFPAKVHKFLCFKAGLKK